MLKRRPQGSGAVQLGGEQPDPTSPRPRLQANDVMRMRLEALRWHAQSDTRNGRAVR
jgi:hypothetical protein